MQKFQTFTGVVCPLDRSNVDTDAIIPKQFLKSIKRTGFGPNLFDEWRYLDHGEPGMDNNQRPVNPDFVLNDPRYAGARILLTRENFGCGSSREHAPWALLDYGLRAVISTEIADIFRSNSLKNGFLPIVVDEQSHAWLMDNPGCELTIDVDASAVLFPDGTRVSYPIDEFARYCLLEGIDQLGFLQKHEADIRRFEEQRPWKP